MLLSLLSALALERGSLEHIIVVTALCNDHDLRCQSWNLESVFVFHKHNITLLEACYLTTSRS